MAAREREQLELRKEMDAVRGKGSEVDAHSEQVREILLFNILDLDGHGVWGSVGEDPPVERGEDAGRQGVGRGQGGVVTAANRSARRAKRSSGCVYSGDRGHEKDVSLDGQRQSFRALGKWR